MLIEAEIVTNGTQATACAEALGRLGHRVVAIVEARAKARDVAFICKSGESGVKSGESGVARCTDVPNSRDLMALRTMLKKGPFMLAVLVSPQPLRISSRDVICCSLDGLRSALEESCA